MLALLSAAALCIDHVHDGDTFTLCGGERIRIVEIDAPELPGSPRCERGREGWCDYRLAVASRDELARFLAAGDARIDRRARDSYGRTLAEVTVNGRSAGAHLVALGLARRWR